MSLYLAILHLYFTILSLYLTILHLYLAIFHLYVTILHLYFTILSLYLAILHLYLTKKMLFVLQESGKPPESSSSWSLPYGKSDVPACGPAEGSHTHSAECTQRTLLPPPLHPSTHRKPQRAARSAAVPQRRSTASVAIETHFYSELLQLSPWRRITAPSCERLLGFRKPREMMDSS